MNIRPTTKIEQLEYLKVFLQAQKNYYDKELIKVEEELKILKLGGRKNGRK